MTTTMTLPVQLQGLDKPADALHEQGVARLQQLSYPTMKDEHWRRTDPEFFKPNGEAVLQPESTFELLGLNEIPSGITFGKLEDQAGMLPSKLFTVQKLEKAGFFAALNGAAFKGGTFLQAGKDVSTGDGALLVHHHYKGQGVGAPRSYLEVGAGSSITLIEYFTCDSDELLAAPSVEVHVAAGARFRYIFVNQWNDSARVAPVVNAKVEKDGYFQMMFAGVGAKQTKAYFESDLVGEGSKSEVLGMVLAQGRQHYDIDAQQNHRVGSTVSDVLCHVALTDRARSVFAGNILCEPGAQKIDGYQQNRNMLLSDKARADSMPRLEIEANDVRCTHGASFSTYDPGQRFYLQSRGLTKFEAERLIVRGFFTEVAERLDHELAAEWLDQKIEAKMTAALGKGT